MSVDLAKSPLTLLLEEINRENGTTITAEDILVSEFIPDINGKSKITLTWKHQDELVGSVELLYQRMDLAYIYSLTGLAVKEVDYHIPTDLPLVNDRLLANILHRYKMTFNTNEYTFTQSNGVLTITANDQNVAFRGSVEITPFIRDRLELRGASYTHASGFISHEQITVYPKVTT